MPSKFNLIFGAGIAIVFSSAASAARISSDDATGIITIWQQAQSIQSDVTQSWTALANSAASLGDIAFAQSRQEMDCMDHLMVLASDFQGEIKSSALVVSIAAVMKSAADEEATVKVLKKVLPIGIAELLFIRSTTNTVMGTCRSSNLAVAKAQSLLNSVSAAQDDIMSLAQKVGAKPLLP